MEIDKIKRVVLGKASWEEREGVRLWMEGSKAREIFLHDAKRYNEDGLSGNEEESRRIERMWKRVAPSREKRRRYTSWHKCVVAACVTVVIGLALWRGYKKGGCVGVEKPLVANTKGVKLVLPDGSSHDMSGKTLKEDIPGFKMNTTGTIQGLTQVSDTLYPVMEYNEIIVPRGGEYALTLSDGTIVILNSETRIRFPNRFLGSERKVFLSGEAYFDVARDANHPFLVEFQGGKVKVLGTQFNVQACLGQNILTTLVSGKVEVFSGRDSVVLHPGELCEISLGTRSIAVREADMMSVLAWKNGEFIFKDVSMDQIVREFSRWYDTEIEYDSLGLQDMKFHVYMDRTKTLKEALQVISRMEHVTYELNGKKIIIKKR